MRTTTTPVIGFIFALITAIAWGTLPIAMKQLITDMSPPTIIFYRFLISSLLLWLILFVKKQLPEKQKMKQPRLMFLIILGTLGLVGNFVLFACALRYLPPSVLQVIAQLSTVYLMIVSVWVFKETLRQSQILGICILMIGLVLFFNTNLIEIFTKLTDYSLGVFLALLASLSWVFYGVTQKILLKQFKSQQILLIMYILCVVFLFPFAEITQLFSLSHIQLIILFYCGLNTIIGYGALAEAMDRWQVSQVSAIITTTPLFTLLFSDILAALYPQYFNYPPLNFIGYIGIFSVVGGAMIIAVGHHLTLFNKRDTKIESSRK